MAGIDGALTCVVGGKTYDVQAEYRSSTGLKVLPRLENVKNAELVEQRSEEVKQLESQVQSYKNVLDDYVLLDMNNKTITYDQPISEEKYNALKNPSYCCLVLSKAEALQYLNLCKQKENLYQPAANNIVKGKSNINANIVSLKSSLSQLLQKMNAYAIIRGVSGFTDNVDNLTIIAATSFSNINDNAQYICDDISKSSGHSYNDDESNDSSSQTTSESSTYVLGKDIKQMIYQRNLLVYQISEAQKNLTDQQGQVEKQIELIKDKRSLQIDQFNDYYKEYINLKFKFDQTIKHLPVNYLTDGTLYKGFNKFGDLVAIFDSYNNLLNIEYADSNDTTRRIKRVYDGEDKVIEFEYNSKGLLTCVTNPRGQTRKYTYNAPTKINGAIVEGESDRLGRIESSAGQTVDIRYTKDNTNGKYEIYEVASGDHLKTRVNYAAGKLSSVYDYSTASAIKHGEVTTSGDIQLGYHTVSYTEVTTTISNQDGNKAKYLFDDNEFVVGEIVEESGKVVSAKMYDYIPYSKNNIQYAKKDILNKYALSNFDFVAGDTESTVLNAFNNPVRSTTNARKLNADGTVMQMVTVDYTYNNDQKVTEEKTTIAVTGKENVYGYKKYYYNAQKLPVRTESFTEEKKQKSDGTYEYAVNAHGTDIEEVVYDEKGNVKKSFMYNSLDSSSKFYKESEYMENGQVKAEKDETGENKTEYEYIDGTNLVRTETLPNGSKFSYGHDKADRVTGITQSTEAGEENSNQTCYTCGEVTEVRSGNNVVEYAYDYRRRMTKAKLNGTEYVTKKYVEGSGTNNDEVYSQYVPRGTDNKSDYFKMTYSKKGNLLSVGYALGEKNAQPTVFANLMSYNYDNQNRLINKADGSIGNLHTYVYDELDRQTQHTFMGHTHVSVYGDSGEKTSDVIKYDNSSTDKVEYGYSYTTDSEKELSQVRVSGMTESYERDVLGRMSKVTQELGSTTLSKRYGYYKQGDHATQRVNTIFYGKNGLTGDKETYTYDGMGNIVSVNENGRQKYKYGYDKLSRLIFEKNLDKNEEICYTYDNKGNILSKSVNGAIKTYRYAETSDQLMEYDGSAVRYDGMGNPVAYRGSTLTWEKGRWLSSLKDAENNLVSYTYDGEGIRKSKTVAGKITNYIYEEGRLLREISGSEVIDYLYGAEGIIGLKVNGSKYVYRKNVMGDVTHIYNESGEVVGKYSYSAYGECKVETDVGGIGERNPIRYRSYYYDNDTGLYYLKTRYYDAEVGRFITIDDISYLAPETINGLNLYAYCGNNPVMFTDPNGTTKWWEWLLGAVIIVGALALSVVTAGLATPISAALGGGMLGAIVGGAVAGAIGGAIAGFGISVGLQGISNGFNNIDWMQVGKATLSGAISGFIAGGVFGGIKQIISVTKVAKSLSGLNAAQANMDKATLVLKNTPMAFKGGVMATERIVAQLSYNAASASLGMAQSLFDIIKPIISLMYSGAQFGLKQLIGYGIKEWF